MFEKELNFLDTYEEKEDSSNSNRDKISDEEIVSIKNEFGELPNEYLCYLKEVGWGSFRECQFAILLPRFFEDFYEVGVEFEDKRYVVFGDNFMGDTTLFDIKNKYAIVEFWHDSRRFHKIEKKFIEYLRECMAMDENGNDMSE